LATEPELLLLDEVMAGLLILSYIIGIAMELKERKRKNLPAGRPILNSKVQKIILQGFSGVFDLLYLVLAPFLLLFGYFDQLLGWSTVSSLLAPLNILVLLQFTGIALFLVGEAMVVVGHLTLKEQYADLCAPSKLGRDFIRAGIYSRIRHPIYSGTMMFMMGLVLFFQTWFGLVLLIPSFAIIVKAASKEEEFLRKRFGKEYERYLSQTRRFLPKLRVE
jgi:protein-S-isoprenylcysteine O-methyltransferase Ste14